MISAPSLLLFALASLMLNITPGNDMIFVATNSIQKGFKAGALASLGITIGCLFHIAAAACGLSAIVASSPTLFNIIKYLGAAYLIYIGVQSIRAKTNTFDTSTQDPSISITSKDLIKRGIITNIFNPKVGIFFLSFLPQFILTPAEAPNAHPIWLQMLLLGTWFNLSGQCVNLAVAHLFAKMGNILQRHPIFVKWQGKITGGILCALGLKIALQSCS